MASNRVWDCATGNGQAAVALTDYFDNVIATDASAAQIDAAIPNEAVTYSTTPAEQSGLDGASVDLVTVGQAFHWFDHDAFFQEASRVLTADGVLAIWAYVICEVDAACDKVIDRLYTDIVGEFWPPERDFVASGYEGIQLPGEIVAAPELQMTVRWRAEDMLGFVSTWSACKRYEAQHGEDPVSLIAEDLQQVWGTEERTVTWPVRLKVCRPNRLLE